MANRFSLTRVKLAQFRNIDLADVQLGQLVLLVGPNGSGKSNFLDALQFVSDSLNTSLDHAVRARGGIAEVRRRSARRPTHFKIDLELESQEFAGQFGFEVGAVKGGGYRVKGEYCEIKFAQDAQHELAGQQFRYAVNAGTVTGSYDAMTPADDQRLYLVIAGGLPAFKPVYQGLLGINIFNINPEAIRQPQPPDSGDQLLSDGANLASVVHRLQLTPGGRAAIKRIESYLAQIVPGTHVVTLKSQGGWEAIGVKQDVPGAKEPWEFAATSLSDGTLRALGVLVSLFADPKGATYSPVGIEEPESALHPAASAVLLDALRDASERRQVIVTSHSPDLLDRDDFTLDQIRAVRLIDGSSVIAGLDAGGRLALREKLYTPGELLRIDQLIPARGAVT